MRIFIFKITCLVVPVLVLMISLNYIMDPANIFHESVVDQAVDILVQGQNVEGLSDYDERELQIKYICSYKETPDVIAIGSSRVLQISQDMIEGSFLNNGVSGAGLYDYIGIAGIYKSRDMFPKRVIIGLDPWILNKNNGDTRYKTLDRFIRFFQGEVVTDSKGKSLHEIRQLISPSYFQNAIRLGMNRRRITATKETEGEQSIKRTDGSIEHTKKIRERSWEEINADAIVYISGEVYQIENYTSLDDELKAKFENLIEYFTDSGAEVVFYLPPYHPIVYRYISEHEKYKEVLLAEKYFEDFAMDNSIAVYGSYDPATCNCDAEDFVDGMHLKSGGLNKIFSEKL